MFKIGTFFYSIKQGVKMLFKNRNFSLAAISTMTACIFLFGIFYFVLTNLQNAIKTAETTVGITVFFDDELPQEDIDRIGEQIKSDVRVGSIEFKSAEQTWQEYKDKYLTGDLAESFGDDNPLENSASYTVYTKNVEYQKEVVAYIKTLAGVRQVNSAESLTDTLQGINTAVMYVSLALIIILSTFVSAYLAPAFFWINTDAKFLFKSGKFVHLIFIAYKNIDAAFPRTGCSS